MVLFSPEGKLKKYNSIEEILETFYNLRLQYYHTRKEYMISLLKKEVATLSNKARFIKMVIEDELIIKKKKRVVLVNELYDLKFDTQTMLNEKKIKTKEEINAEIELQNNKDENSPDNQNNNNEEEGEEESNDNKKLKLKVPIKEYDYLLNMNLWSLTYEKIEELLKQKELKEKELSILEKTEVETLWNNDLDNFEVELEKYEKKEEEDRLLAQKLNKGKSGKNPRKRRGGGRKKKGDISDSSSINDDDKSENSVNISDLSNSTNLTKEKKEKKNKGKQSSISDFLSSAKSEDKNKTKSKIKNKSKSRSKSKSKTKSKEKKKNKNSDSDSFSISVSKNSLTESSEQENDESSFFKMPLKERIKQRNINIGSSPLPIESLKYGPSAKRDELDDFSDLDLSFDDKEKKME